MKNSARSNEWNVFSSRGTFIEYEIKAENKIISTIFIKDILRQTKIILKIVCIRIF